MASGVARDYKQDLRIVLRVRPPINDEIEDRTPCLKVLGDDRSVAISSSSEALARLSDNMPVSSASVIEDLGWVRVQRFAFDRAYEEQSKQSEIYSDNVRPLVFRAIQVCLTGDVV